MTDTQTPMELPALTALSRFALMATQDTKRAAFRAWLCDRIHAALLFDLATVTATEGNPYATRPDDQRRLAHDAVAALDSFLISSGWM